MNLYFDYDSTLNDLTHTWVDWINFSFGTDYSIKDVDTWEWFYDLEHIHGVPTFDWFKEQIPYDRSKAFSSKPIAGAVELIKQVKALSYEDIIILTATHCNSLIDNKDKHISHFFGDICVKHTDKKHHYAYNYGENTSNVLLDDKPQACVDWVENGGVAMLFTNNGDYTYAKTDFKHKNLHIVDNYDEVFSILGALLTEQKKSSAPVDKIVTSYDYLVDMKIGGVAYYSYREDNSYTEKYTFTKVGEDGFSVLCHNDGKICEYESAFRVMDDFGILGLGWSDNAVSNHVTEPEANNAIIDLAKTKNAKKRDDNAFCVSDSTLNPRR